MTNISNQAAAAREDARTSAGQFGEQQHTAPESTLAGDDGRAMALDRLVSILADHPEQAEHAREFIEPKIGHTWMPDLIYVEYDDKLGRDQLDAYLTGYDEQLDEIEDNFRDCGGYWDYMNRYAEDLLGCDIHELGSETEELVREWIQEQDRSTAVPTLVRHNGDALIQLPAVADDDAFGVALRDASEVEDEQERYAAIEKVFHSALTDAGIQMDEGNARQVRELIDENSLDFGPQSSEQWRLRLVAHTDPEDVAMSSYGEHRASERKVTLEHPWLLLVDPWNGRSHDVRLNGNYTTTITPDRPARLDAVLGNGSLDEIAGVYHSAYRVPVKVEETAA